MVASDLPSVAAVSAGVAFDPGFEPEFRDQTVAFILDFRRPAPSARPAAPKTAGRSSKSPVPASRAVVEALYREHNEALVGFLRGKLHNDADAWEAAQESYVRLLQLCEVQRPLFPKAYLFRIAANVAMDLLRGRRRRRAPDIAQAQAEREEPTQERVMVARQQLQMVEAALGELPPVCREAFMLARQPGWSTTRVADHLGISDRTARRYVVRTLEHLHAALNGEPDWSYHCG